MEFELQLKLNKHLFGTELKNVSSVSHASKTYPIELRIFNLCIPSCTYVCDPTVAVKAMTGVIRQGRRRSFSRPDHLFYDIEKAQVESGRARKSQNTKFFEARSLMLRYRKTQVCGEAPKNAKMLMPDGKISHSQAMTVPNIARFIKERKIIQIESMPGPIKDANPPQKPTFSDQSSSQEDLPGALINSNSFCLRNFDF